jgi:hypothetical protein
MWMDVMKRGDGELVGVIREGEGGIYDKMIDMANGSYGFPGGRVSVGEMFTMVEPRMIGWL